MSEAIVVFAGDFHCGSSLGLMPPSVQFDDGQILSASSYQLFIWQTWLSFWQEIADAKRKRRCDVVFFANGELVDDNWHKTPQVASRNLADIFKLSEAAFEPARAVADRIIVTRGTEAHSGGAGAYDELMAQHLNAVPDAVGNWSRYSFYGSVAGVYVDVAHHPGHNSMRPWTKGGEVNRLAADVKFRYFDNPRFPQLVIRGHIHRALDSYDNHEPVRALVLPSWKLNDRDAWGQRFGGGVLPIGGAWAVFKDGAITEFNKRITSWPIEHSAPETVQLAAAKRRTRKAALALP